MPEITLRKVDKKNVGPLIKLGVADHQRGLVGSNAGSLAEAYVSPEAWPRGIYADDTPVGFIMLALDEAKPEYWVWRMMVGAEHQGRGYGRAAMLAAIEHVRGLPGAIELKLSFVPEPGNPQPFYESLGFELTGEEEEGEILMRIAL